MKKLLMIAVVAAVAITAVGCGAPATTKPSTGTTTASTEVKKESK